MLAKFRNFALFFILIFSVCFLSFALFSDLIISAVFIAGLCAFLVCAVIASDGKKIDSHIKNLLDPEPNRSDEFMFLQENSATQESLNMLRSDIKRRAKESLKKTAKIKLRNNQLNGILSSISHEFKNPISIIDMSSKALEDGTISEKMRDNFIEKIGRNSKRIVELIDKLNLKSTQSLQLEPKSLNLHALVSDIRAELLERYKEREISIESKDIWIHADDALIRQVLINIIENALKYSQDRVEIYFTDGCVFVRDYGVGIEQKDIKLVTKKYFKTKNNTRTNSFGIGLYVVKQILKLHGFELIISSELGKGSVFGFRYKTL